MSKLIEKLDRNGELVSLEDGFIYYFPRGEGGLSAHELRAIADELDRRNASWEKIIEEEIGKHI